MLIPRTFHAIWMGDKMPKEYVAFRQSWLRLHPGWTLREWNEENMPPLVNQRAFDEVRTYSEKSDIARVELLYNYGGVYVDADFECFKNIEELIGSSTLWVGQDEDDRITGSIMGAVAGHGFLEKVMSAIPGSIRDHAAEGPVSTTGPALLDRIYKSCRAAGDPVPDVMPRELFFPYRGDERHRRYEVFPDAYAAHHWGGSWHTNYDSPKEVVRRALMKRKATRSLLYAYHDKLKPKIKH